MPSSMVKSTLQAAALSLLANVLAQLIRAYRAGTPFTLNLTALLQFVTYSILSCPPNCLWQAFLEAQFPAYAEKEQVVHDATMGHSTAVATAMNGKVSQGHAEEKTRSGSTGTSTINAKRRPVGSLSIKNTAIKFTLDQTLGAAVNTVLFITGITLLRGQSLASVSHNVREQFWPMTFAGQKLWPAVSILSFTIIPLEQRMLFGSVAGLFWGTYLSLIAASSKV